ncbi:hypothetical protein WR25_12592 isoform D [Diploscapter pachys]|uniref:Rab-GAP TBC domain-containing protein n=1 Tax=Diploscapter pachys TaxID=2018661 RepID=A0A2A2KP36_9BILA|nr:hypothetical protein WR25_12592 isoform C [Diploscapter pachys]PAV75584.1 hypothetical protein WR25_12592 isoform D [Diploscapter pachys]
MSTFGELLKKAQDAITSLRGGNNYFLGKDGDIVFSKNNVCIHEASSAQDEDEMHTPGYLTIHCQQDEQVGVTLVLQWLPNTTLHKNPASIRSVSPRGHRNTEPPNGKNEDVRRRQTDPDDVTVEMSTTEDETSVATSVASNDITVEMNGDVITVTSVKDRPKTLMKNSEPLPINHSAGLSLGVPSINVIPNTPIDRESVDELRIPENQDNHTVANSDSPRSQSSMSTSGADENLTDLEDHPDHSSSDNESDREETQFSPAASISKYRESCASVIDKTPEQFALEHDLMLTEMKDKDESIVLSRGRAMYSNSSNSRTSLSSASLFSVNLGKMRTMRLFYSNPEGTCGQLVIATHDSHYKILHFHHGGLDKLAHLFEQWSAIKTKSVKDGSPSPVPDRHLIISQPEVSKGEMDPEDGLYEKVNCNYWRSLQNSDGAIDDAITIKKAIFFASMEPEMRKEIWPFLLRVFPWQSTVEQRETIRNDLFLDYQNIRKKRNKKSVGATWEMIENTVWKDVVRTDRKNPFYYGDDNPNIETLRNILLNFASTYPEINYIQGMSDLCAPLLITLRDEVLAYWCFNGLMQLTVFSSNPKGNENLMETNLDYLRELLQLFVPSFYLHLCTIGGDALHLMFVHRWILLFFKREFPEIDALHIWEACWARYRTSYFHLFVCTAIVSIYGTDVVSQKLPHDEILLYFSSLGMHMDASVVLKKARGLLYDFVHRDSIPCSLAGLCAAEVEQWDSHRQPQQFHCVRMFRFIRDHIGAGDTLHEDSISSYTDYRLTVRHGFPLGTTCMAIDNRLSLIALGTDKGEVLIYGSQGLVWDGALPGRTQNRYVAHLYFALGKGALVALCSDGEFYRFKMTGQHLTCDKVDKDPRMKKITSCHMIERPEDVRLLLIGTVCGNIYSLNIETLELAEYLIFNESIQPRLVERNPEFSGKTAINFIVSNPEKPNEMLLVLDGSLIVHYNSSTNELIDAELLDVRIESVTWTENSRFYVAQSDGEYSEFSTKPLNRKLAPSIFGPYPCMPILKVILAKTRRNSEPIMLISGGMLRATFGDRHTLTAKQGDKLVIFDLATPILDFEVFRPDKEETGNILLILTENEIIMIDLDDEEWKPILSTHFYPLHASTITAQEHCNHVEEHIWKMLLKYSDDFWVHSRYSKRSFPFSGGHEGIARAACSASNDAYKRQLYIAGHENGTVHVWAAGGFSMRLLFVINTAKEFAGYEDERKMMSKSMTSSNSEAQNRSHDSDKMIVSDDWPPFAKVGEYDPFCDDANLCIQKVVFDGKTGNLAVASRGGHILLYTLSENHNTLKPSSMNVQLIDESLIKQNSNLRNNSKPMPIRTTEESYRAGYQPFFNEANKQSLLIQLLPSTNVTSLALLSNRNYLAAGNEFGYVLIDWRTRNEIMKNTLFSNMDLQQVGALGNTLSRFRTMKQSIRQTFRRKKRTHTNPNSEVGKTYFLLKI